MNKDEAATKEDLAKKADADHRHDGIYYTKEEVDNNITDKIEGIDFSVYATKEELATKAAVDHAHDISEINDLQDILETKINKNEAATKEDLAKKSDSDHKHDEIYYTKEYIDNEIIKKADKDNVYTKEEIETSLAGKSDSDHKHEIERINNLQNSLDAKANASDVYTKNDMDLALALKMDSSARQEIDAAIDLKLDKADINVITNEKIDELIIDVFDTNS
jgi:hypothetical protein